MFNCNILVFNTTFVSFVFVLLQNELSRLEAVSNGLLIVNELYSKKRDPIIFRKIKNSAERGNYSYSEMKECWNRNSFNS